MSLIERYCIKRGCYYHDTAQICPEHGIYTKPVREALFEPPKPDHDGYTLREINGLPMGGRKIIKTVDQLDKDSDTADAMPEKDIQWNMPMPKHIIWKDGKKLSLYQGVKL